VRQYPNLNEESTVPLTAIDGSGGPAVDNEGEWIALSGYAGIKSDGTLWCWLRDVVSLWNFKRGGDLPRDAPVKISDDTDWVSVSSSSRHGVAIKSDGTLWSFGTNDGGCLGIGLSGTGPWANDWPYPYRAILSCSIKKVNPPPSGYGIPWFTEKPEAHIEVHEGEPGSGAVLDAIWSGAVSNYELVDGGSGYTSKPRLFLVGNSEEDAGKVVEVTEIYLSQSAVESFNVIAGGFGYTYATAYDQRSQASADAVIVDGRIVGWNLTYQGVPQSLTSFNYVIVTGDGEGASASATYQPRSVTQVNVPSYDYGEKIWTSLPTAVFEGGGGSGAEFVVTEIRGKIDGVRVVNGGSGYTRNRNQRPWCVVGGSVYTFDVELNPGRVTSLVSPPAGNLPQLSRSRSGRVAPFSWNAAGAIHSASLEIQGGESVPLTFDGGMVSMETTKDGLTYPPFIVALNKAPGPSTVPATISGVRTNMEVGDKCTITDSWRSTRTIDYYSGPTINADAPDDQWPLAAGEITINGEAGSSRKYEIVDGELFTTEWTGKKIGTKAWFGDFLMSDTVPPETSQSTTLNRYTGPIAHSVVNVIDSVGGWLPPSIEEVARIYFSPPDASNDEAPYAEATPQGGDGVTYGYASSPQIITEGGLYTTEPATFVASNFFEYPVQVGNDTWLSASATFLPFYRNYYYSVVVAQSFGVKSDGTLCWWGRGTACGDGESPSPSPIGRAAAFDFSSSGEGEEIKATGFAAGWNGSPKRNGLAAIKVSIPEHGTRTALADNGYSLSLADTSAYGWWGSNLWWDQSAAPLYADGAAFGKSPTYYLNGNPTLSNSSPGLGYISPPTATVLASGDPIITVHPRLLGPSTFAAVKGAYAMSSDGQWFSLLPDEIFSPSDIRVQNVYKYDITTVTQYFALSGGYTSTTRTKVGRKVPYVTCITAGGSGYTEARATTTAERRGGYTFTASDYVVNDKVTCERYGINGPYNEEVRIKTTNTWTVETTASTPEVTESFSVSVDGRVLPTMPSFYYWWYGFSGQTIFCEGDSEPSATASVSGDGEGCEADVVILDENYSYTFRPVTPPGATTNFTTGEDQWGSRYYQYSYGTTSKTIACVSEEGETLISPPPYISWYRDSTLQDFVDVSGRYWRKEDGSVWTVSHFDYNSLTYPTVSRVLSFPLTVDETGSGYENPAAARAVTQPGVATLSADFDAHISAIGMTSLGSGYETPPAVYLTTGSGFGETGTATATIAGPVESVSVAEPGSGYRIPPRVVFSGQGRHAYATCTLNESGGVESVQVSDGGRYRNAPPGVSFEPVYQVESLSITSGGSGYTSAPSVHIGSGGGVGATAKCRLRAQVIEVVLTNPGANYTSAPTVLIGGTATAIAGISFLSRQVTGITIQNGGDYYEAPPEVTIFGGGGSGATAYAKISGYVDQITLLSRGEGFVESPQVVFYDGGGGSGAAATATRGAPGGGAEATARIDGSLIFCTHEGSSGLQTAPVVSISDVGNFRIAELWQQVMSNQITLDEFTEQRKKFAAVAKARIEGAVTGISVTVPGSGYKDGYVQAPTVSEPLMGSTSFISSQFAERAGISDTQDFNHYGRHAIWCGVAGTSISSATLSPYFHGDTKFWRRPEIVTTDGAFVIPTTCITLAGVGIRKSEIVTDSTIGWAQTVVDGIRPPQGWDGAYNAYYYYWWHSSRLDASFIPSPIGSIDYFQNNGALVPEKSMFFSDPPTVTIEDEAGTGAAASIVSYARGMLMGIGNGDGLKIDTPGSGYTLYARPVFKGGRPKCWEEESKAVATAEIDELGRVQSITMSFAGDGYTETPDVFLCGGGGSGATAKAIVHPWQNGSLLRIDLVTKGSGYTSPPTVAIVDNDRPFETSVSGKESQADIDALFSPLLRNYSIEYCHVPQKWQVSIESPVRMFTDKHGAEFVPLFADDGYVESVRWLFPNPISFGCRPATAPEVESIGRCNSPAELTARTISWSNVMSSRGLLKKDTIA
jgi:hypothetical protein